jgi:hypothetical protein
MNTDKQRIEELERRVRELETRPQVVYVPYYVQPPAPPQWPSQPHPWYPLVWCGIPGTTHRPLTSGAADQYAGTITITSM